MLRPFVVSDAPSMASHANDREIWLNVRDRFPHPYNVADAESYIERVNARPVQLSFAIDIDGEAAGGVVLMPGEDVERFNAEIGYWLGRSFWARGIMTDAVRAVTTHGIATLGFHRIFAIPFARNPGSIRVLEKAGYVREGHMRRSAVKDGQLIDQLLYAAYDDTWPLRPGESP
jgi:[ribosomal protein S5]-alanine N-acetyltransferase